MLIMEGGRRPRLRNTAQQCVEKTGSGLKRVESKNPLVLSMQRLSAHHSKLRKTTNRKNTKTLHHPLAQPRRQKTAPPVQPRRTPPAHHPEALDEKCRQRLTAAVFPPVLLPASTLAHLLHAHTTQTIFLFFSFFFFFFLVSLSPGRRTAAPRSEPREPEGPAGVVAPAWEAAARFGRSSGCGRR